MVYRNACPHNIWWCRVVQCKTWQSTSISLHQSGLPVVTTLHHSHMAPVQPLQDKPSCNPCRHDSHSRLQAAILHDQSQRLLIVSLVSHTCTSVIASICWAMHCRYRQKRHERNFTKRIKYMCRKTLADTRPRVRGRFARNNDAGAVMPHETKKALAAKAKAGKAAAAAQGHQMPGASPSACTLFFFNLFPSHLAATSSLKCCVSMQLDTSSPGMSAANCIKTFISVLIACL